MLQEAEGNNNGNLNTMKHSASHLLDLPLSELVSRSHDVKLRNRGTSFSLCTILNVKSGACSEDCAFCAQSARYGTDARVYPYRSVDDIVERARAAKASGASRFSLVASGRGPSREEIRHVARCVSAIREQVGIRVCASLGLMDADGLKTLRDAGLTRYHHNLETGRDFFPRVVTTHSYDQRVSTILAAREAGLEVCSGGIIGLGESWRDRLDMALELGKLKVDSVPLNILVPIAGTPLEHMPILPACAVIKTVCLFRILLPDVPIRLAGGRESALPDMQGLAFWAGADAMLIGGYLTVRGRAVDQDLRLVKEVKELWKEH